MNKTQAFIIIGILLFSVGSVGLFVFSQNDESKVQVFEVSTEDRVDVQNLQEEKIITKENMISAETEKGVVQEILIKEDADNFLEQENSLFHFSVVGDSEREKSPYGFDERIFLVMDKIASMKPDLVFFTGDMITVGTDPRGKRASINYVKKMIDARFSQIPYHIVLGYHDVECGIECLELWQEIFFDKIYEKDEERVGYHSFDYQNTHFVLLSTDYPTKRTIDKKQMQWLEADLENNKKENTIVLMHVPPVTFFEESAKQCHDFGCQPQVQKKLQVLFEKNDVDLVISGHEQAFDHKIVNGVDYILSGNSTGSDPRYKNISKGQTFSDVVVRGKSITVKGTDVSAGTIREIKIK